jgi:SNF2 family DNA or RNA helicase
VVTAYSNLQTDSAMLQMINWDIIITDEAQNIKNPRALRTRYLKMLNRKTAIAVSGTPFENHMTDVWSIVDFIIPNYLGSLNTFEKNYGDDLVSAVAVEQLISPIMIRRKVKDVGKSLPPRIDVPVPLVMTRDEAKYYEDGRLAAESDFGLSDMQLEKIQKLRMFCTHPIVYNQALSGGDPVSLSNKYARFCELLDEIFMCKEKVIVFTSFSKMIQLIVDDIKSRFGVYTNYIDGSVDSDKRQNIIDEFSSISGAALLALNPIAAGAGLNITAANHVIHYNLEWNPAKEDQASARAHRTGQTKTVVVHRLFYVDTIEETINDMIQRKREISETTIVGNIGESSSREQLIKALSKTPYNNDQYE